MPQSILHVLQSENPLLDASFVRGGTNTFNEEWKPAVGWRVWREFTLKNLTAIYGDVLKLDFGSAKCPPPKVDYDREIRDERSLDLFLARFILPDINRALGPASRHLGWQFAPYLAPGSWTGYADWQLVSRSFMSQTADGRYSYTGLLPGDTKLSAKWQPAMETSLHTGERQQWALPVSQVMWYAFDSGSRYGFIITDLHLVILRVSSKEADPDPEGPRQQPPRSAHQRIVSDSTEASDLLSKMSLDSPSAYSDTKSLLCNSRPEYVVIPWEAKGEGKLTVKLALFFVYLMAGNGQAAIQSSYPPINSWAQLSDGTCQHNTSCAIAKRLPRGAKICNQGTEEEDPEEPGLQDPVYDYGEAGPSGTSQFEDMEAGPSGGPQFQNMDPAPSGLTQLEELEAVEAASGIQNTEAGSSETHHQPVQYDSYDPFEGPYDQSGQAAAELPAPRGSRVKLSYDGVYFVFEYKGKRYKTKQTQWKLQSTNQGKVYVCETDNHTYWATEWPSSISRKRK